MTTVALTITGMHCASCAALIEEVLAEQPGLLAARVDLEAGSAEMTFDGAITDVGTLQTAIAELGYGSSPTDDAGGPSTP